MFEKIHVEIALKAPHRTDHSHSSLQIMKCDYCYIIIS